MQHVSLLARFVLMGLVAAVGSACDRPAPDGAAPTTATADSSVVVRVYTALESDQLAPLLEDFKQTHPGIEVLVTRDSTNVVTAKLLAEGPDTPAEVIWGLAATSMMRLQRQGMLQPYAPPGVEFVDSAMRDSADPPHWVGTAVWMTAFSINRIELERRQLAHPRSFADLASIEYRGLVTMPNPASSGTGFLTVSAVLQRLGEPAGWEFLDRLHENVSQYTHSGSKPVQLAATGEYPIGVSFDYRAIVERARGKPLDVVFPSEGSGWDMEAVALVRRSSISPAARSFVDWAISARAFALYGRSTGLLSRTIPDVARPAGYPDDLRKQLSINDFQWASENHDRIIGEWTRRYNGKSEAR